MPGLKQLDPLPTTYPDVKKSPNKTLVSIIGVVREVRFSLLFRINIDISLLLFPIIQCTLTNTLAQIKPTFLFSVLYRLQTS